MRNEFLLRSDGWVQFKVCFFCDTIVKTLGHYDCWKQLSKINLYMCEEHLPTFASSKLITNVSS